MSRALSPDRSPRHLIRDILLVGLATGVGMALVGALATWRVWTVGELDEARPAGAIIVLGAAQYDGRPSPVFAARLDHAVRLYEDGLAPLLVVTGGKRPGDSTTEAETARRYAIARGVPAEAIAMEDEGRDTLRSMRSAFDILRERGIGDAIFVSDRTHMLRVLRIARDAGLTAWGSPTPTSPIEHDLSARLKATGHELASLALYFIRGAPAG